MFKEEKGKNHRLYCTDTWDLKEGLRTSEPGADPPVLLGVGTNVDHNLTLVQTSRLGGRLLISALVRRFVIVSDQVWIIKSRSEKVKGQTTVELTRLVRRRRPR